MAKRIYEPCGKIESTSTSKTAKVKTHLPVSILTYRYVKYYNISTPTQYGILGVLVHDGLNIDLTILGGTSNSLDVSGGTIDLLNDLDNSFSQRSFANVTDKDSITFICFHDDNFESNNRKYNILRFYQSNLPNYYDFPKPILEQKPSLGNKGLESNKGIEAKAEPMIGNGGILTFTGSCK